MKKAGIRLIVHKDKDTKTGFSSRIQRDVTIFSGTTGGLIILGLDETGKINVYVSDPEQQGAHA